MTSQLSPASRIWVRWRWRNLIYLSTKASIRFWRRRTPKNSKTFILKCIPKKSASSTLGTIRCSNNTRCHGFCFSEFTNKTLGSSATSCRKHDKGKRPGWSVTFSAVAESPHLLLQPRLSGLVARPLTPTAGTRFDQPGGFLSFQVPLMDRRRVHHPLLRRKLLMPR